MPKFHESSIISNRKLDMTDCWHAPCESKLEVRALMHKRGPKFFFSTHMHRADWAVSKLAGIFVLSSDQQAFRAVLGGAVGYVSFYACGTFRVSNGLRFVFPVIVSLILVNHAKVPVGSM